MNFPTKVHDRAQDHLIDLVARSNTRAMSDTAVTVAAAAVIIAVALAELTETIGDVNVAIRTAQP